MLHNNYFGLYYLGPSALSFAVFGQGTGAIALTNVACSGSEARLIDCSSSASTSSCSHSEDAGVRCLMQSGMQINVSATRVLICFIKCFAN